MDLKNLWVMIVNLVWFLILIVVI
ncbi:hypothetical protein CY0110_16232 [Crocosphaera chwakensis CCY0110]|uniref:Uncharacterized protein n=1 Tax=Crocosphaera chwakensis CCY0110 TaxID=391612 RepID=A3IHS8_9CHRO|nr:hypothetical protein CY0110_16232 [Crocosphaera chwakensis CCY0110]